MPPQTLDFLRETAVLKLDEVLTGVQPAEQRQTPQIPPALSQAAYGETVIDSRLATPGSLFVALSGEKVDGHHFLANAVAHGASAALAPCATALARKWCPSTFSPLNATNSEPGVASRESITVSL